MVPCAIILYHMHYNPLPHALYTVVHCLMTLYHVFTCYFIFPAQVVRHELHITNQIMHLRPPVEMGRCRLVGQLHEWVNTIAALPRIQSSRYQVRGVGEGGREGGWRESRCSLFAPW